MASYDQVHYRELARQAAEAERAALEPVIEEVVAPVEELEVVDEASDEEAPDDEAPNEEAPDEEASDDEDEPKAKRRSRKKSD